MEKSQDFMLSFQDCKKLPDYGDFRIVEFRIQVLNFIFK